MTIQTSIRSTIVATLVLCTGINLARAQGGLSPSGPPAPSMKTLQQVEPRTPISSLPFSVSVPGSYYLTGPLSSTNSGITVSADDVTVDLMGFTISGAQNTNHPGIHIAGGNDVMRRNVVIRNGGITRFGKGVLVENIQGGRLNNLVIHQNTAEGISLLSNDPGVCTDITIEDCTVTENTGIGIFVFSPNIAHNNRNHTIRNNRISGNGLAGVRLIRSEGCTVDGNFFGKHFSSDEFGVFAVFNADGRNVIVRNFEQGNTNGIGVAFWSFNGNDTIGQVVSVTGYLGATNNVVSPWANFSR